MSSARKPYLLSDYTRSMPKKVVSTAISRNLSPTGSILGGSSDYLADSKHVTGYDWLAKSHATLPAVHHRSTRSLYQTRDKADLDIVQNPNLERLARKYKRLKEDEEGFIDFHLIGNDKKAPIKMDAKFDGLEHSLSTGWEQPQGRIFYNK